MKSKLILLFILIFFASCSTSDVQSIARAALSKNPAEVFKQVAINKSIDYAVNPKKLSNDIGKIDEFFAKFIEEITNVWGEQNKKIPNKKEYVKYLDNFKSRALVDFDKGIITIETLEQKDYKKSLNDAVVTTVLLPDDPRAADLFNVNEVKLGETPYLLGEIKDYDGKDIRYEWRANRFASKLLEKGIEKKVIKKDEKDLNVYFVQIPMVKDHANVRVAKFKPFVKEFAKKYNLSENLVYAIIKTESNFNQFAVSSAKAYGLMQIVPHSGGKDSYKFVKGKTWTPTKEYLFNAKNNIELGTAYLKILNDRYLTGILDPISKEYSIISAYNTGSGNVLKVFSKDRVKAKELINQKKPQEIYEILIQKLPYEETRRYLQKVINNKKLFVNI